MTVTGRRMSANCTVVSILAFAPTHYTSQPFVICRAQFSAFLKKLFRRLEVGLTEWKGLLNNENRSHLDKKWLRSDLTPDFHHDDRDEISLRNARPASENDSQ